MKNKLLLVLTLILCVFVSACSCNKFDIDTYTSTVKNYKNSVGIDYKLVVTTVTNGSNKIISKESSNVYEFSTTREVLNFSSTEKTYEIATSNVGANGDPEKVYEINRYYVGNTGKFHTIIPSINSRNVEDITYEEKYNASSEYHLNNIVPVFNEQDITDFNIEESESKKGYSIATFKAACPTHIASDNELIEYKVTINKDYYFEKIEFTIINGDKTSTYVYTFNKYNNDVKVTFPNNLA